MYLAVFLTGKNNHGAPHEVLTVKLSAILKMPINNILTTCSLSFVISEV